jgi:hypothetical protein
MEWAFLAGRGDVSRSRMVAHGWQDTEQRGSDALAHGPAFERSVNIYAVTVAFGDQAPLPSDDESRGLAVRVIPFGSVT